MRVVLKEREYEYESDFPDGWVSTTGGYSKFPVLIGKYQCFIKRFDKRSPNILKSWGLHQKIKSKFEPNLPRIFDIVSNEESGESVFYIFYEYINGKNLDNLLAKNGPVDLPKLLNDLFSALRSIHQYQYWFADFREKNIYWDDMGRRFLLTDIDRAQPVIEMPYNFYTKNDYWDLILKFYKEVLGYDHLNPTDLSGPAANYLQVVFLVLRLKMAQPDNKYEFKSSNLLTILPAFLDKVSPVFRELFARALQEGGRLTNLSWTNEIKQAITQEIINKELPYSEAENYPGEVENNPVENEYPSVKLFKASTNEVAAGSHFTLYWEVENTTTLKLFRNKIFYKTPSPEQGSIDIKETFDGKTKKVVYTLLASNDSYQIESDPITVTITDNPVKTPIVQPVITKPVKEAVVVPEDKGMPLKPDPIKKKNNKSIRLILLVIAISLISIILIVFLSPLNSFFSFNKKSKVYLNESNVSEGQTLALLGEDIPQDSNQVQVLFNNVKGKITQYAEGNLQVIVPVMGAQLGDGKVKVAFIADGDTSYAATDLYVKASTKLDSISTINNPNLVSSPLGPIPSSEDLKSKELALQRKLNTGAKVKITIKPKKTTITTPPADIVQPEPEVPKEIINLFEMVSVKSNVPVKKSLGGIKHLEVTVYNNSRYDLDNVTVEISYQKSNEKVLGKQTMTFANVKAHTSSTLQAPDFDRGKKFNIKIASIASSQVDQELKR